MTIYAFEYYGLVSFGAGLETKEEIDRSGQSVQGAHIAYHEDLGVTYGDSGGPWIQLTPNPILVGVHRGFCNFIDEADQQVRVAEPYYKYYFCTSTSSLNLDQYNII